MTGLERDGIISAFKNMISESEYFDKWAFRSEDPEFEEDELLKVYIPNNIDENEAINARIGDTIIEIINPTQDIEGSIVEIKILNFNTSKSYGEAELISSQ